MLLLGYDIGSSSIKASLVDAASGQEVASARSPSEDELSMDAPQSGWAEQHPDTWWKHVVHATESLHDSSEWDGNAVGAIGITYQMHGLVLVDESHQPVRPSIIWCDSRAVDIGEEAFDELGHTWCLEHLLNSPANFTAAKLAWVRRHQPDIYERARWAMLPGDYIALRLSGEPRTSYTGLSEGTLWDVQRDAVSTRLLEFFDLDLQLLPKAAPSFGEAGTVTSEAANTLGISAGIPISYRAGDQPNNALSMGVLEPGQAAATAGTSGVVYAVSDIPHVDEASRVNIFLHVNYTTQQPRFGTLMCVNGTGILNRWMREQVAGKTLSYEEMNERAAQSPIGANGLQFLPYGNGAERTLGNRDPGASLNGIRFNSHTQADMFRAAQEGIVFGLKYGCDIMRDMGLDISSVRAPYDNMFLSELFANAFATALDLPVEMVDSDGARGAALGAGIGVEALPLNSNLTSVTRTIEPVAEARSAYLSAYDDWLSALSAKLDLPDVH